ncbi:MAG: class I adenylate-forming enzyme family protein [Acidimicrobiales bacterium]|jgi:acyl-CoA synthetase (AMP-forming)/AMP-acid ligase II|nr:class I adenylate-forming enzyme family protein [Acidimicrobiales bacterium]HJM29194.1 class I adenylate-forming enzyme family protein [Acidimicrobiales bacterium]HJM96738.1 class I adenylate-forming enzyme family protein [Acidimicrobiales bacterium]
MLATALKLVTKDHGSQVAYETANKTEITYQELDQFSDEVGAWLKKIGIVEGSVVALCLPSHVEYIISYLAVAKVGGVTAGVNPRFTSRERQEALEILNPELVITTKGYESGITNEYRTEIIELNQSTDQIMSKQRLKGKEPGTLKPNPERPVCICFTSGSTGKPKGAWFANKQLQAISDLDTGGSWGGGGSRYASTEFAHVGVMTKLPWLLSTAGTTHLVEKWNAKEILQLIHDQRMTSISAIAPQVALMLKQENITNLDFRSVQAIVTGGAFASPNLIQAGREIFGAPWSVRYSSTESGGIGLGTDLEADDSEALYTVGRPREGVKAKICDSEGKELPKGEIGEIWLSSSAIMSGYWNDPEATALIIEDDWLKTGDLAYVNENHCFVLAGRTKEMFIRGGYNVFPLEVEGVLSGHSKVSEIVIVPRQDQVMGEIGVAVVVPNDNHNPPTLDELREFGEIGLASYKLPEAILCVKKIPRNATDKIDRKQLFELVKNPKED